MYFYNLLIQPYGQELLYYIKDKPFERLCHDVVYCYKHKIKLQRIFNYRSISITALLASKLIAIYSNDWQVAGKLIAVLTAVFTEYNYRKEAYRFLRMVNFKSFDTDDTMQFLNTHKDGIIKEMKKHSNKDDYARFAVLLNLFNIEVPEQLVKMLLNMRDRDMIILSYEYIYYNTDTAFDKYFINKDFMKKFYHKYDMAKRMKDLETLLG